jgi:hypothetical protein
MQGELANIMLLKKDAVPTDSAIPGLSASIGNASLPEEQRADLKLINGKLGH